MALYHFHVTQIKRSAGQSAIGSAAYRAGEKLYCEYYGEYSRQTRSYFYGDCSAGPCPCRVSGQGHIVERSGKGGA